MRNLRIFLLLLILLCFTTSSRISLMPRRVIIGNAPLKWLTEQCMTPDRQKYQVQTVKITFHDLQFETK